MLRSSAGSFFIIYLLENKYYLQANILGKGTALSFIESFGRILRIDQKRKCFRIILFKIELLLTK
jgi:hypothetical protein